MAIFDGLRWQIIYHGDDCLVLGLRCHRDLRLRHGRLSLVLDRLDGPKLHIGRGLVLILLFGGTALLQRIRLSMVSILIVSHVSLLVRILSDMIIISFGSLPGTATFHATGFMRLILHLLLLNESRSGGSEAGALRSSGSFGDKAWLSLLTLFTFLHY